MLEGNRFDLDRGGTAMIRLIVIALAAIAALVAFAPKASHGAPNVGTATVALAAAAAG
jgi:hypothetical protein